MSDETSPVNEVIEEQPTPEVTEQPQEQVQEASVQEEKPEPKRKDAEYNFAELRRQREEDRRRADEAEKRANELLAILKQNQGIKVTTPRDADEEELDKLAQDDLLTVKHGDRKLDKKMKPVQQELKAVKQELAEIKMRSRYPDLDEVLSPENIELLKKQKPQLANIISRMNDDDPEKTVAAYEVIKTLIPVRSAPIPEEKKKALENAKKPISAQGISKNSAIGNVHAFENGLTKDLQKQLWQEMQDAIKRG